MLVLGIETSCDETAAAAGRAPVAWHHQLQTWVGVGRDRDRARAAVAGAMERFYGVPFRAFERYTPYGSPAEVAEFLRPYVDAGVRQFNITPCGDPDEDLVALTGEIRAALLS